MSFPSSVQLQLLPSSSLQSSRSPENGDFDSDTDLQFFDASEVLVNYRRSFIYSFGRDTAEDEAAENGDFERDAAEDEAAENGDFGREAAKDEASEDAVDGNTVNY